MNNLHSRGHYKSSILISLVEALTIFKKFNSFIWSIEYKMDVIDIFKQSIAVDENYVFVLMPFEKPFEDLYKDIINPVVTSEGFQCEIADQPTNNAIIQDIIESISKSRFIIADISGYNENVMYELGIAHALQKEVIIIYDNDKLERKIPSDIRFIRARMYYNTASGGLKLKQDLTQTIDYVRSKIEKLQSTEEFEAAKKEENTELFNMVKAQFDQRQNRVEYFTFHIITLMSSANEWYQEIGQLLRDCRHDPNNQKLDTIKRTAKIHSDFIKNHTIDFTNFQLENARNFLHSAWLAIKYPDELHMLHWEMSSIANLTPILDSQDISRILESIEYKINRIDFHVSVMQEERKRVGLQPI